MTIWVRVNDDLRTHRKALDLEELVGEPRAWAYMVGVWGWCATNAEDGVIRALNPVRTIEAAAGWRGKAGKLAEALVKVGFIDFDGTTYQVHDWMEHNGKALAFAKREADRGRQRRAAARDKRIAERDANDAQEAAATEDQASKRPRPNRGRESGRSADETADGTSVRDVTGRDVTKSTSSSGAAAPAAPLPGAGADPEPPVINSPSNISEIAPNHPPDPVKAVSERGDPLAVEHPPPAAAAPPKPRKPSWQQELWDEMDHAKQALVAAEIRGYDAGLPVAELNTKLKRYAEKFGRDWLLPAWECWLRNEKNAQLDPPFALQVFLTDAAVNRYVAQAKREAGEQQPTQETT